MKTTTCLAERRTRTVPEHCKEAPSILTALDGNVFSACFETFDVNTGCHGDVNGGSFENDSTHKQSSIL